MKKRHRIAVLLLASFLAANSHVLVLGFDISAARAAESATPDDAATALLRSKNYAEAEAAFRKVLAGNPNDTKALEGLGQALGGQNKFDESAKIYERLAEALLKGTAPLTATASAVPSPAKTDARQEAPMVKGETPVPVPTAAPNTVTPAAVQPAATQVPNVSLQKSALVVNNTVAQKDGKPINGIKLSHHDLDIGSPSIAVAPDGTIHVAFVEQHGTHLYDYSVYHRSSSDGGKVWTEAKNLSEDMPGVGVGRCLVLVDPRNRVYVIWRAGLKEGFMADVAPYGGHQCNLWFRVFEAGKWSKPKLVAPAGSTEKQNDGTLSYFATIDDAGRPQVVWNSIPDKWHSELCYPTTTTTGTSYSHLAGIGNGLVFQATLDGINVGPPHEIFLPPIGKAPGYGLTCDGLDTLNGYVDSSGAAHFVAAVSSTIEPIRGKSRYELIESGKAAQAIDLPELSSHGWSDIPTLLVDASGGRHVIALFLGGEHPNIRDYLLGSDDAPVVIRAATGTLDGFQAYQGPGGRMITIMQMDGDTYISISTGNGWSTPVNVTNNEGRRRFASTQTSSRSNAAVEKSYVPGPAAATVDRDGHLLLLMINKVFGSFSSTAFGVELVGGDSSIPALQFLRF